MSRPKDSYAPTELRDLLRDRGLNMPAAAVLADVDTATISRIVNGKTTARPETIVRLAKALGVSATTLKDMAAAACRQDAA